MQVFLYSTLRENCTTHKELVAIVTFKNISEIIYLVRKFYSEQILFLLIGLRTYKSRGMIARWKSIVDMYDFEIVEGKF